MLAQRSSRRFAALALTGAALGLTGCKTVPWSPTYGTTTLWDFIGTGYVSDAYVLTGSDGQVAPTCK